MRKIVLAIVFFSCLMQQQIIWANDTGVVVVCIEGSQITDSDAIQKSIQQSAGQKAVRKALGRFIAPALEADSIFQTIVAESEKYVIKPVKVLKTEKRSGKKLFFCEVQIDFASLEAGLRQKIQSRQESAAHQDDEVFFFIRVTGINEFDQKRVEENNVMNVYADAFQTFGFHKSRADEIVLNTTEKYKDLRVQDYLEQVRKDISNNVEISIAVVGEINLLPSETDAGGINSSSFCRLVLVKNSTDGQLETIGTFSDEYTIRRSIQKEAEKLVLQKAAYNSAKYLAHLTLEYWQRSNEIY